MNAPRTPSGIETRPWGTLADGRAITETTLHAGGRTTLSLLDLGGIVTAWRGPDRQGRLANVMRGLASMDDHLAHNRTFGSLVGRYANRIAGGRFTLDGVSHELARNSGPHTLHGGHEGFGARFWSVQALPVQADGSVAVDLSLVSEDGDQGFPGRLTVQVRYTLTPDDRWRIDYRATTDRPTVVNLTHHAYWNLAGHGSALGQRLTLSASQVAQNDADGIPVGFAPVDGTPFDFRQPQAIDARLREPHPQIRLGRGYDHYVVIDRSAPGLAFAARLEDEASGRVLEIATTEPGLQLYTGNFLDATLEGADGQMLRQGDGVCLETQHAPDAPHRDDVPGTVLRPGEIFRSTTEHRLGVMD